MRRQAKHSRRPRFLATLVRFGADGVTFSAQLAYDLVTRRRARIELLESLRIALTQIRANKLRSALTALGVIIGIVAVSLMVTAVLGINAGVDKSLAGFGSDVLYVTKWPWRDVRDWWNYRNRRPILTTYARQINAWIDAHPEGPLRLAVPVATRSHSIKRGDLRVFNIHVLGTSADLPRIGRADLLSGRFFNDIEYRQGNDVAVIGYDVADSLFRNESPLGRTISCRRAQLSRDRCDRAAGQLSRDVQLGLDGRPPRHQFPAQLRLRRQRRSARADRSRAHGRSAQ